MKPYIFPNLFVTDKQHNTLLRLFESYSLIKPLDGELRENVHYIDKLAPYRDRIISFIDEYRYLSNINPGIPKENLKFMRDNIHYKNELSQSSIRSSIKTEKKIDREPRLNSGIFLQLSYDYDLSSQTMEEDLRTLSKNEDEILNKLKNTEEDTKIVKHPGSSKADDRLQAWLTIMNFNFASNVFITSDHEIFDIIVDNYEFETILSKEISQINGKIDMRIITELNQIESNNPEIPNNYLTLYRIKKGPEQLFENFISKLPESVSNISDFTVIGVIS